MVTFQYFYTLNFSQNYKRKRKTIVSARGVLQMVWNGNELHMFKLYNF